MILFKCFIYIWKNQTDVLTVENIKTLIKLTKEAKSVDLLKNLLKLLVTTCVLCENNRQMYVENVTYWLTCFKSTRPRTWF